jgi:Methyltransferase domain
MFFDDYPVFADPGKTAAGSGRLNLRHVAIIEENRDILEGARVLDLASHDGRWSFAALQAGAEHVTGVEAREPLVESANKIFANYGVPDDHYSFVAGDMFDVLAGQRFRADVVMCLGFLYHTLRYGELFKAVRRIGPEYFILDTRVISGDERVVQLNVNRTDRQEHAAKDATSYRRRALVGRPSRPALQLMLDMYDIEVEREYDWSALLADHGVRLNGYSSGERVTLRCRVRPRARRGGAGRASRAGA